MNNGKSSLVTLTFIVLSDKNLRKKRLHGNLALSYAHCKENKRQFHACLTLRLPCSRFFRRAWT
ncbi:hypothetical protein Krac_0586 [Ktedonobacter racemifer DSM 44963]|uniref:Uncharacterized protein n=1 Tax=Ktedonobacter racemifer DSM 44963 TaxID=485913 RepID=D6U836_KTERA|nr:hypothetical protein Krac_0586 [Ktedonobacter racemifer DSM 44963]